MDPVAFAAFMQKYQYLVLGASFLVGVAGIMLAGWLELQDTRDTRRKHIVH